MAVAPIQLGPYRIGQPLGKGGMGTVFAAIEETTGETAAVKVLSAVLGREEGFRERFAAEIESLRKLRHPNIVRLHGYGVEEDWQYYAMELVEGQSLDEAIRSGRSFGWREAVDIGLQICRALRHAHDRGVIHRDIKPANLLVTPDGLVKLSDFGIAKLFGNTGLTSDGGVLGTADYMSPEQADGRPVTHRCDLYGLGGVLYTLIAGRPPFRAKSVVEMLQLQRYSEPEPLGKLAPHAPVELEDLVRSMMNKEPERRIPTALAATRRLEMIRDLPDRPQGSSHGAVDKPAKDEVGEIETADDPTSAQPVPDDPDADPRAITSRPRRGPERKMLTTALPSLMPPRLAGSTSLSERSNGQRRFTAVAGEDEYIDSESWSEKAVGLVSPQTWVLIVSLLIVGFSAWYLVQPPSADRLYERIIDATEDERVENRLQLDQDIKTFLTYYPSDTRSREVERAHDSLVRWQLKRRMDRLTRQINEGRPLSSVQRAYIEALRFEILDPERCISLLTALVGVYSGEEGISNDDRLILELSRQKAGEITRRLRSVIDVVYLDRMVDRFEALGATDPDEAYQRLRDLKTLYDGKPDAQETLQRVDLLLEMLKGKVSE